jgi:CheY-like chemotaxis protein
MVDSLLATGDAGAQQAAEAEAAASAATASEDGATAPADDRDRIAPGDQAVLIVGERDEAEQALQALRRHDLKGLVAAGGPAGLALAHEHSPDAIVVAAGTGDAALLLDQLKHHPRTRHIPVFVIGEPDARHAALLAGAARFLEGPASAAEVDGLLDELAEMLDRAARRVLVVEDDEAVRRSVAELIGGEDVEVVGAGSSEEALQALEGGRFGCIVLDLKLPGATGFDLLEHIKGDARHRDVPVIIHTGKALTRREETRLKRYADAIVVKDAASPERLLDETALHLHRAPGDMPDDSRRLLEQLHHADSVLHGRRVLIVDDDVRNVFALTSVLENRGVDVVFAENGREGLQALDGDEEIDLVLMDLMMPEMDGYEAMAAIRARPAHRALPIIALTAKAMQGDRERSIAAGASDYITTPVDPEQLLSLMRVWLYR